MFALWLEANYKELYKKAVDAFPHTTKRQNIKEEVILKEVRSIPFYGLNTYFVKGITENGYKSIVLFKNVKYIDKKPLYDETNNISVRCSCGDFHWRFTHFNHLNKSLYGRDRAKYEAIYDPGSANPTKSPGLCKHLMKLIEMTIKNGM